MIANFYEICTRYTVYARLTTNVFLNKYFDSVSLRDMHMILYWLLLLEYMYREKYQGLSFSKFTLSNIQI